MAHRPAKRQRRSTVILSDDENEDVPNDLPLRTPQSQRQLELNQGEHATLSLSPSRTRSDPTRRSLNASSNRPSPKSSPEKTKKTRKAKEPDKSKAINSFFGRVSDDQRWRRKSNTPEAGITDGELDDAIQDDDLSDSAFLGLEDNNDARSVLDRRKQAQSNGVNGTQSGSSTLPPNAQRFIKPSFPAKTIQPSPTENVHSDENAHRPWADRYGPTSIDELAIHKKKATDVQKWLENVLSGRDRQRLLILRGPAGSGKTTTVSLLSKALGFSMSFWQNPSYYDQTSSGSVASQFEDFLSRGGGYGALTLGDEASSLPAPDASGRHALVVEEFPAGMARSSGSDSFRSVLRQFLARSSPSTAAPFRQSSTPPAPPVVMIISETLLSSSTAFSDSFTAHRLLGPDILNHPLTTVIEFNPVAPTILTKALDLVVRKEARDSKRKRVPGPAVLQKLAEMGDIRNAVSSLEFLCVRGDSNADWSGTVTSKPTKAAKSNNHLTEMERSSLQLISQRETTLDMFHAAGKIVYNKRDDPRINDPTARLPPRPADHLMHLYSPKVSQVDIEALLNETGTDIQTFISTLHENHALSCNGDSFADTFEGCSDVLSISDVLNPDSRRALRSPTSNNASVIQQSLQGGTFDALRQDEISFNVASRGLLFNLPYPVHRAAPSSGRKADAFKMFYPTSLRIWKPTEEIEGLIDLFVHDVPFDSSVDNRVKIKTEPGTESVSKWKVRTTGALATDSSTNDTNDDDASPIRKVTPSRASLTLETLPYLTRIKQLRTEDTKTLRKITHFSGSSVPLSGEEPSDDDEASEETIVGARKVNTGSRFAFGSAGLKGKTRDKGGSPMKSVKKEQSQFNSLGQGQGQGQVSEDVGMEQLYLEDDDIVDD